MRYTAALFATVAACSATEPLPAKPVAPRAPHPSVRNEESVPRPTVSRCDGAHDRRVEVGSWDSGPSACRWALYHVTDPTILEVVPSPDHCPFDVRGKRPGRADLEVWAEGRTKRGAPDEVWCFEVTGGSPRRAADGSTTP